jgi:hypothetical protein
MSEAARKIPPTDTNEAPAGPATAEAAAPAAAAVLDTEMAERSLQLPVALKRITEEYGKPLPQVLKEFATLGLGAGKVSIEEYLTLRLFDDKGLAGADKRAFTGSRGGKTIAGELNYNEQWLVATGHKMAFEALMTGFGYPTPKTKALYSHEANYPAFAMLRSAADLKAYLTDASVYPLFGKPVQSSLSLGTAGLEGYDQASGSLRLTNGREVALDDFIADVVENYADGYILQDIIEPHPQVAKLAGRHASTVRFYTLGGPNGVELFRACWKITAGANMSDNIWRGNILAALDYETGQIKRAVRGSGLDQVEVETHPDTGTPLVGFAVPEWQRARQLVLDAAQVLAEIPVIGWDVAISSHGPLLVEANDMPDFRLAQMVERRGIIDDQLKAALAHVKKLKNAMKAETAKAAKDAKRRRTSRVFG